MKIFKDPNLQEEITSIYFGKVEAGKSKRITVYLYNDSEAVLTNLTYEFPSLPGSEKLEINGPITIQPKSSQPLTIEWKPSVNFKKALELPLTIKGEEVYLAKKEVEIK